MTYTPAQLQTAERMHAQAATFRMQAATLMADTDPFTRDAGARLARFLDAAAADLESAIADPATFPRILESFQNTHADYCQDVRDGTARERMRVCEQACAAMGYRV